MVFHEWVNRANGVIEKLLDGSDKAKNIIEKIPFKQYYDESLDPELTALIIIQETKIRLDFDNWMMYIDLVINKLIGKDSSDIEDMPYHELWEYKMNPLLIAFHSVYKSSETIGELILPVNKKILNKTYISGVNSKKGFRNIWEDSKYFAQISSKIDTIMQRF